VFENAHVVISLDSYFDQISKNDSMLQEMIKLKIPLSLINYWEFCDISENDSAERKLNVPPIFLTIEDE
jgi:hypothetical protein